MDEDAHVLVIIYFHRGRVAYFIVTDTSASESTDPVGCERKILPRTEALLKARRRCQRTKDDMFAGTVVRCDDIDVDAPIGFVHRRILQDGERWADALAAVVFEFIGRVNGRRDENGDAHEQKSEHDVFSFPSSRCRRMNARK